MTKQVCLRIIHDPFICVLSSQQPKQMKYEVFVSFGNSKINIKVFEWTIERWSFQLWSICDQFMFGGVLPHTLCFATVLFPIYFNMVQNSIADLLYNIIIIRHPLVPGFSRINFLMSHLCSVLKFMPSIEHYWLLTPCRPFLLVFTFDTPLISHRCSIERKRNPRKKKSSI